MCVSQVECGSSWWVLVWIRYQDAGTELNGVRRNRDMTMRLVVRGIIECFGMTCPDTYAHVVYTQNQQDH